MIYAFFRGGLAAMAALLVEIFIATFTTSLPNSGSFSFANEPSVHPGVFLLILSALIEELAMFVSLLGLPLPLSLPRRALFLGISAGIGFSLFEASVKILFLGSDQSAPLASGIIGGSVLHVATGILLGLAVLFWKRDHQPTSLFLFLFALALHIFYNISLAPTLSNIS